MHADVPVVSERLLLRPHDGPVDGLHLADGDTASERSGIGVDPVVRDFGRMVPTVEEDGSATLRTVDETNSINTRRVTEEVAAIGVAIVVVGREWCADTIRVVRVLSADETAV